MQDFFEKEDGPCLTGFGSNKGMSLIDYTYI